LEMLEEMPGAEALTCAVPACTLGLALRVSKLFHGFGRLKIEREGCGAVLR
jgi:hypothetical protein